MYSRPLVSKADIVVLAGVVVLVAMLVPTVFAQQEAKTRELDNRRFCATTLKVLGQSLNVYGADNSDAYPVLPPPASATAYDVTFKPDVGGSAEECLAGLYKSPSANPLAALWILVLEGDVGPKNFLCKSDPIANVPAIDKLPGPFGSVGGFNTSFQDGKNISYSVIYPWTLDKNKKVATYKAWSSTIESALPIMSDMAPYLGKKAKPEEAATRPADSKLDAPIAEEWAVKKANARNHLFEGQNVVYGDGHAEFNRAPTVGENGDSIWGIRKSEEKDPKDATETVLESGVLPHAPMGSSGNYDVVMVPTRDAKGNLK